MPGAVLKKRVALEDVTTFRSIPSEYVDARQWMTEVYSSLGLSLVRARSLARLYSSTDQSKLLNEAIAYPFEPKSGRFKSGRYNSSAFACLYTSYEPRTACIESLTHLRKEYKGSDQLSLAIFEVSITGMYWDLLDFLKDEPRLTCEDYGYTQEVGSRARNDSEGVRAPSARCEGKNVATFTKDAAMAKGILEVCRCRIELSPVEAYEKRSLLSD